MVQAAPPPPPPPVTDDSGVRSPAPGGHDRDHGAQRPARSGMGEHGPWRWFSIATCYQETSLKC